MTKLNAAQRRYLENATLIAATRLIFDGLEAAGVPLTRLDVIADTTSGGTPSRSNSRYYEGDIPWIKSGELEDDVIDHAEEFITEGGLRNSSAKIFPKGTLLVALYGATVGKTGILAIDAATNQAVCAVMPKTNDVTTAYLHWFLRHKRPEFLGGSFGGAQPNISQKVLRETVLPLPSVDIQKSVADFLQAIEVRKKGETVEVPTLPPALANVPRLVARIEALAAKIEEARGLRRLAVEEAEALKISALDAEFKQLEGRYPHREIQEVCEVVRGGSPRPAGSSIFYGGDIPFIKVGDITKDDGKFLYEAESTVNELGKQHSRYISEDTLMLTNSGATLGVPKITKIAGCFNDGSQAFLNLSDDVFIEYLYYFFKSRTQWFRESPARGQGQPNLNTDMVKPLKFPCPPLEEQRRIVAYLDGLQGKVDALKALQAQTQAELDALLPSVLDKAFKGELL